jgi:NitT/TauT family transport system substrate-binding protein
LRWARASAWIGGALVALALPAQAADPFKLKIACTATSDCASAMIARDQGIFAKHGLDVDMTLIGINTNIPPAIVSDSIQIGGPTEPVFLQAVDGGLDLVAIAGASKMDPNANQLVAAMSRNGLSLKEAKDFIGKKVGAPGVGAYLHVLFRKWLIDKGVDPKKVNFVEVTFPNMSDTLKSNAMDAVLTAEPFITRILKAGNGEMGPRYVADLAQSAPIISYVSTRAFAEKNPEVVKAFRESIAEAAVIGNSDHEAASQSISKFTKQPIEIVRLNKGSLLSESLKSDDLRWWVGVMKQQDMLQTDLDASKVVWP